MDTIIYKTLTINILNDKPTWKSVSFLSPTLLAIAVEYEGLRGEISI